MEVELSSLSDSALSRGSRGDVNLVWLVYTPPPDSGAVSDLIWFMLRCWFGISSLPLAFLSVSSQYLG